ncbi:MAG: Crp/Fnr family transcriptional regulator [Actinomycetota bacterium]
MSDPSIGHEALRTGIFSALDETDADGILAAGQSVSFEEGQAIFETGDRGDGMFIVTQGEARVDVGGRFHILKAGDFFGEMAVIAPGPRMATVKAVTAVEAVKIGAEDFQAFLLAHPKVSLSILKAVVLRLREVEQRIDAWMA